MWRERRRQSARAASAPREAYTCAARTAAGARRREAAAVAQDVAAAAASAAARVAARRHSDPHDRRVKPTRKAPRSADRGVEAASRCRRGIPSPANVASSPGGGAAPRRSRVSSCPLGERTRTRLRSGPLRHAGKVTVRCKSSPRLSQPDCLRASPTASAATLHLGGVAPDSANATVTPTAGRGHATRSPAADPGGRYVLRGSPPLSAISRVMRCPKADA
mmetsp:Transcript_11480/g.33859  ORF Transcript_11480/g.33859 Transcript_11480/m.33859 type:complete len:220 (-) Transcript_11480:478-1137(-)